MFNEYPYRNIQDINLDFILKKVKECIEKVANIEDYKTEHEPEYQALKKLVDDLYNGNLPPTIYNEIYSFLDKNAIDLLGSLVKSVFFGITDDGYFIAYIPESWNDIQFGTTGLDDFVADVDYGHLTLSY